jgi:hypothetical protein
MPGRGLACAAAACVLAGCAPSSPATSAEGQPVDVAPYLDLTLEPVLDLGQVPGRGVKLVNLAFVTADGHACGPEDGVSRDARQPRPGTGPVAGRENFPVLGHQLEALVAGSPA